MKKNMSDPVQRAAIRARLQRLAPDSPRAWGRMTSHQAICHLSDRLRGEATFVHQFPGGEPPPSVAELKELQERLTKAGFDTGGANGRVGSDTTKAVRAYQKKAGIEPADGYAGLKVLARLRQG